MNNEVSKRGVYYNLEKSPHEVRTHGLTFKFSSASRRERFIKKQASIERDYADIADTEELRAFLAKIVYKQVEPFIYTLKA